ncbi:NAD-dependent succinate-semialdehyde dehydrogenase [Rhodococcus sp. 15-725-2-2b]|uniref:NAD-dependent succinate-semialdehyde dehydrogenase n=1 Tax=unclassified Rhodococcus (in: high G+C Gram-positive bacteria) TaxID=192944 RepID=UPI000B9B0B99|nr:MULTISPECIES: NAD-dependent succinate-semialdehyde dehydrogenase [unclassified Rhodococcus (in: high G+C Gram-positive bacteria)]OZC61915.1 NAD-dependent succinate-semialdehyde dehydrogenase [Rhodococcus sp. 06-470-2]OZC64587.1 NAD-dependent succinate-semialdehyde dehydrogenase [Rhodococcus sp. 06-469-3-2]OZD51221.1 NAD-dependent succinate-semialdehyde dehydrogenase [Rhodococcus sp. 06-1477-1A]OZE58044.1 NAD-dependent succinate-semialdehyde dehydrogenase [Rhodococcus sp. 05-2221-1B]OZE71660
MTTDLSDSRSSQRARATIAAVPTGVFIGGEWEEAASGERFEVIDPASGHVIATVADGGPEDAQRAIEAAGRVQKDWAKTSPRERSELLRRAYELMLLEQEDLALIITSEMGKPIGQARDEVAYAAEFFRWFSEEAVRVAGDVTTTGDGKNRIIVSREPVGPCVLITPWNFPLAMGTRKIGPAIAAGCTVVFKPANLAPLASLALVDILVRVGLPEGVVNVVCTTDASAVVSPWMASGIARKISFTGSTAVGVLLLEQASRHVMRSSMELGGNAPFIVFEDANLDRAVEGAFAAKMRNMGEACTAANRILVQRSVADEFARRLAERLGALSLGDGVDEATEVGPLVDKKALTKVEDLVGDALRRGAKVICGGARPDRPGYFYLPTVLVDVPADADLMFEEIFGPVAAIVPFDSEDEAVRLANDTPWGLAAYLFTQDVDRSFRVGDALEVGMVGLNTGIVSNPAAPFGGVKASGLGREGGRVGIDEFLEYKYMAIPRT